MIHPDPTRADLRGLYAIIDPEQCGMHHPIDLCHAIVSGGCGALQLRAKRGRDDEVHALADAMLQRCRAANVPFLINDRVDLARRVRADGVHLGQEDMSVQEARCRLGPHAILGLSTHSTETFVAALSAGATYLAVGPLLPTGSKADAKPVLGWEGLRAMHVARRTRVQPSSTPPPPLDLGSGRPQPDMPMVAIGGLDNVTAVRAVREGASMAAMIGAIARAPHPRDFARDLHAKLLDAHDKDHR